MKPDKVTPDNSPETDKTAKNIYGPELQGGTGGQENAPTDQVGVPLDPAAIADFITPGGDVLRSPTGKHFVPGGDDLASDTITPDGAISGEPLTSATPAPSREKRASITDKESGDSYGKVQK